MRKIIEFQKQAGLKADGIIGKITAEALRIELGILTNNHLAHFLGQCHIESAAFSVGEENLNYSKEGLLKIFPKYFTSMTALAYARKPEMIANRVYANRMGNGSESSGDGFKYKGAGAIQLTGKINYTAFKEFIDIDVVSNPSLVANQLFFESAKFYFSKFNIWSLCHEVDDASITKVSKRVNGGTNALAERIKWTKYYFELLK